MTLHVFPQGLRTNADDYIDYIDFWDGHEALNWEHEQRKKETYEQDAAPWQKEWTSYNLHNHVALNLMPPRSPDLNPLNY